MICTDCLTTLKSVHEIITDFKQADGVYNSLMSERFFSEEVCTDSTVNCDAPELITDDSAVVVIEPSEPFEVIDLLNENSPKKKKKKSDLQCKDCRVLFMTEKAKEIHFKSLHKFHCPKCSKAFTSNEIMLRHKKIHLKKVKSNATAPKTSKKPTIASSSRPVVRSTHQLEIPWTELRQCSLCNFAALSEKLMDEHVRTEHRMECSTEFSVSAIEPSTVVESIDKVNLGEQI